MYNCLAAVLLGVVGVVVPPDRKFLRIVEALIALLVAKRVEYE